MDQTQADIVDDLRDLGSPIAQYSYLIECAGERGCYPEGLRDDAHLVRDCAVRTWVCAWLAEGVVHMRGDSDSVLVCGALALLEEIYDGRTVDEARDFHCALLDEQLFVMHFSPRQREGLASIVATVEDLVVR